MILSWHKRQAGDKIKALALKFEVFPPKCIALR
jgi:hypothetical protein